ncbi:MAG: hypothetical protein HFE79_13690 [Ruminiclostridium sp.]|nr:hypothetical protein [Ruminiclostridium sp.]
MKRIEIFDDSRIIIETPMLSNQNYSSIASVDLYLNQYGAFVISATNHDGGTGYYSLSLEQLFSNLDEDVLKYLIDHLHNELKNRKVKTN